MRWILGLGAVAAGLAMPDALLAQVFVAEITAADIGGMGPTAIAIDRTLSPEILYVADEPNGRILKFNAHTGARLAVLGSLGFGDGQFNRPYGLAIDPATRDLYVAERGNGRVQRITNTGAFVLKWGEHSAATNTAQGFFNEPVGIAADAEGYVYVVDKNNNRIQKFRVTRNGSAWQVQAIAMWGTTGSGAGQLNRPYGIARDMLGTLWVVEAGNRRLQRFSSTGDSLKIVGTPGNGGGQFNTPVGIGIDGAGGIYVTETNSDPQNPAAADINQQRVQRFKSTGDYDLYQWGGSYGTGPGQFRMPFAIAFGPQSNAYVADYYNQRVQIFDLAIPPPSPQPKLTGSALAYGTVGQPFFYQITADKPVDRYSATGLPPGLSVNTSTGAITGTPSASGQFAGTIGVENSSGGNTASFFVSIEPAATTPGSWQTQDVGAVGAVGSASEANGVVTLRGSGADIWERADEFRFRFQAWSGDGEIVARVTGIQHTHGWAKAGVMIRETLGTGSRHAFLCISAGNGAALQYRTSTNGDSGSAAGAWVGAPRWVRVVRSGNTFIGYESPNGSTWTQVGSVTMTMPSSVQIGLAVTSHSDGALCTATFDNVTLRSTASLAAPTGLTASAVSPNQINLAWTDNTAAESGFEIEGSTNNADFVLATTVNANVTNFAMTGFTANITYYFRVRAIGATGSSVFSNTASATTPVPSTLGAPSGLTAVAISSTQIRLNWTDNATSETDFEWALSTDNVNFAWRPGIAANATTVTIADLSPATTYYFRIRAGQGSALSAASNTASATTMAAPTSPSAPAAPSGLVATVASDTQVNLAWTDNANNEAGFEVEISEDNIAFSRLVVTAANAPSYPVGGLRVATRYYFRVRAVNAGGLSGYTATVSATTTGTAPPQPTNWTRTDVGAVAVAGALSQSGSTYALSGSGEDIWEAADEFSFAHRPFNGDGTFVVRLTGIQNTDAWAKAGIMLRESLAPGSRYVMALFTAQGYGAMQARTTTGGTTSFTTAVHSYMPMWLRLVRTGGTIEAAQSGDGVAWTSIGSITVAWPAGLYAGLAVTSHRDGVLCTATFDNVTTNAGATTPPSTVPGAPTGLTAVAASATQINLSWTDNATNETAFQLERSMDNVNFALVATPTANVINYTDTTVSAATRYYYRVRAMNGGAASGYSTASATTPPATTPGATWQHADVGAVGVAGSDDAAGNTFTVRGSGEDIWDNADGFRFLYQAVRGDCVIEARVTALENTHGWAKAGVMIRESLAPNARNVFVAVTPANGVGLQVRSAAGGATTFAPGPWGAAAPYWVRLVRTGNTFVASTSADGVMWTAWSSVALTMAADVSVGFAVTSHANGVLNTVTFAEPSIR